MWRNGNADSPPEVQQRREDLLRSAQLAIAAHGADSVRLLDVAQVAGVSIGALQHHFGTRDALVVEAYRLQARDALREATTISERYVDPWECLSAIVRYLGSGEPREAAAWIELCAKSARSPEFLEVVRMINSTWTALIRSVLERGLSSGGFTSPLDLDSLVAATAAILDGMFLAIATGQVLPGAAGRHVELAIAALLGVPTRD